MAGVFTGWAAHLSGRHPSVMYLGWLLGSVGAHVLDEHGRDVTHWDLAAGMDEDGPTPWRFTLIGPNAVARYTVDFTGIDRPGWEACSDAAAWGWGGLAAMTGQVDGPPLAPGAPLAAECAALHAAIALAAARFAGLASINLTIALGDVVAGLIEIAGLKYAVDGSIRTRTGDSWGLAGWGLYSCADGVVSVALRDREQLAVVGRFIDQPALLDDVYADFMWGNCARVEEANALLIAGFLDRRVDETVTRLRAARIAVAPVRPLEGLPSDPHLVARGAFERHAEGVLPAFPVRGLPECDARAGSYEGRATLETRPLVGVRVLDLSSVWAGPMAARILADLGATVTKIERPGKQVGGFRTGISWERDFYAILNDRNKAVVACDLRDDRERRGMLDLVRAAGVLIENFVPGSLDRLGLGAAALHALNPRLIVVSMPAMGLSGPDMHATGYGSTIEQGAGLGWLYADADGRPHRSGVNFSDPISGLYAALGALLALCGRRERVVVEVSQQEAALSLLLPTFAALSGHGERPHAVPAERALGRWTYPVRTAGDALVPVRTVPEVIGYPPSPESGPVRAANARDGTTEWLIHPDGRSYPLVVLPWHGAFERGVPPAPVRMPQAADLPP